MAKTSKIMFNNSGESGQLCVGPDFRGNPFKFSPFRIMFAVGCHIWFFVFLLY